MRLEDYQQITLNKFRGLWSVGAEDTAPFDYFLDCLNIDYDAQEVRTRAGLSASITLGYGGGNGKIRRFVSFFNPIAIITLILDDSGNLYTFSSRAGDTATTPLITVAAATDFAAIQVLGKIYIAFHNGNNGISGVNLKVYIPNAALASDEIRDAAGVAPTAAGPIIAADGAAGIVNAGTYKIAVVYLTSSGYYTVPGPDVATVFTPTSYVAPGLKKISLTTIPVLTGRKRQIIITKANLEEYFFLPSAFGGFINDDTTTTATLDFDDTIDLVDSADYLFDLLETIPAPLGLDEYHGRLITYGEPSPNSSILRVSYAGDPESFDSVDGIVIITKDDGFDCKNSAVLRDILYAHKNLGVFAVQDNGDIPANWAVYPIDKSINTPVHGISEFFNLSGIRQARDFYLTIDRSGIILNNGAFRKPPLTLNIDKLWQRLNFAQYAKSILVVDEQQHKVFCAIPIDSSTENNLFLFGSYNECPGQIPDASIQWSPWEIKPGGTIKRPTAIGLIAVVPDTVPTLKIGSVDGGGKLWKLDTTVSTDDGTAIESYLETSLLYYEGGWVHFFTAVRMRITGTGNLEITVKGEDNVNTASIRTVVGGNPVVLATSPGQEVLVRFNFTNEKAKLKFRLASGTKFIINKIEVYGQPMWMMRPA